jgi:acyl-CoA synthetase (AMP-forming)/AMP-acid ligase II
MGSIQEFAASSGIYVVDDVIRSLAAESEEIPLIGYPHAGASDFEIFNAKDLDARANAAASYYVAEGLKPAVRDCLILQSSWKVKSDTHGQDPTAEKAPVAAVLAQSNFEVIITILALNRLNWSTLLLSIRLGTHAYLQLLQQTKCSTLITTTTFVNQISEIRKAMELKTVPLISRLHHDRIDVPQFHRLVDGPTISKKVAFIIHSSGSTGVPKPIYVSNAAALATMKKNYPMRGFCTSPLFHAHGVNGLLRSIYARQLIYFANFALPATSKNLTEAMRAAKPEIVLSVPYILKLMSEHEEGIKELAQTKLVLYAGSVCPDGIGDRLVEGGVKLATNYGS